MKRLTYDEVREAQERDERARKKRVAAMTLSQRAAYELERQAYRDWLLGKVVGEAPKKRDRS